MKTSAKPADVLLASSQALGKRSQIGEGQLLPGRNLSIGFFLLRKVDQVTFLNVRKSILYPGR